MRHKLFAAIICVIMAASIAAPAFAGDGNIYFKMPFKRVLSQPSAESEVVYEVPISVDLLGVSRDKNWYKVCIEFDLMFLGRYKYTGWVYAPVEDKIAEFERNEAKKAALAN